VITKGQRVRVYFNLHKQRLSVMDQKTRRSREEASADPSRDIKHAIQPMRPHCIGLVVLSVEVDSNIMSEA